MYFRNFGKRIDAAAHWMSPIWSDLGKLGENSAVRSSMLWMLVVPVAAKALAPLEYFTFALGGEMMRINLTLPFSWTLLYFAALCFGSASLLYSWWCPRFIRVYPSVREFKELGKGSRTLIDSFVRDSAIELAYSFEGNKRDLRYNFAANYLSSFSGTGEPDLDYINANLESDFVPEEKLDEAFWYVRSALEHHWPCRRLIISSLFAFGGFWLLAIVALNSIYVIEQSAYYWR